MKEQALDTTFTDLLNEIVDRIPDDKKSLVRSAIEGITKPTAVSGGIVYLKGQRPGHLGAKLRTPLGIVELRDAVHVTPTLESFELDEEADSLLQFDDDELIHDDPWSILIDDCVDIETRSNALSELVVEDDARLPAFVLAGLENPDTELYWQGILVAASERVGFRDLDERSRLKHSLLAASRRFRDAPSLREELVWSAVRRFGSIIEREEISNVLEFLARSTGPDTRQVTLQVIQRMFEDLPPEKDVDLRLAPLKDRVHELAKTYIQPDVLTFGSNAALALNAIHALTVLGDVRAVECALEIAKQDVTWFAQHLARRLSQVRDSWKTSGADSNSTVLIDRAISHLQPKQALP